MQVNKQWIIKRINSWMLVCVSYVMYIGDILAASLEHFHSYDESLFES